MKLVKRFLNKKFLAKFLIFLFLVIIFCLVFFSRTYFAHNFIISDKLVRYTDDGMYHMRFLENMLLGGHFPQFIRFDPFVNFPHGGYSNLPPLFDFILASFIWIISLGKPTLELVSKIAPFYPPFLGAIVCIVIYFLAKSIWNNAKISLTASLFSAISFPLIFKSLIGHNDHHIMEVLLSSLALTFLFLSLKFAKNGTSIKNKKLWLYVFLCGFSMGLYLLNWTGAILFLFIIFAFLSIYYLIEFISGCNGNWILVAGLIIFSIPFLMIIPFLGHPNLNLSIYGINHLISFGLGFLGFLALWICALITEKKHFKPWLIIICLVIFCLLVMLCLKVILPDIFEKILVLSNGINNNGNAQINFKNFVGEMKPLKFQEAIDNFSSLFFIYILGFLIIVYNFFKRKEAKNLLLIIWTVIIFLINGIIFPFGQRRFFIYLAVGVSLFSAFIVVRGLEFGWKALGISSRLEKTSALRVYSIVGSILILFNIVFFVIYPFPFNVGLASPQSWPTIVQLAINGVKSPYIISNDWYYALQWLRANTPDPGLDFYALYEEPVVDNKTGLANDYEYPPQAYGVLSSWDFGHAIEYFGRRMVVANNFQVGIGNKLNSEVSNLGEAIFFLETDENLAASYLDQLKVKYIITDYQMALPNSGYFISHVVMTQGNLNGYLSDDRSDNVVKDKVDNSMVARLHLLDGSGVSGEKGIKDKKVKLDIQSLSHFRILYESVTIMDSFSDESLSQDIKAVKIFEYVKGAIIKGYTIPGVEVEISTNVKTNQDREFIYKQKITSKDGSFEFVVPYSTGKQEQSDVLAREYMIKIGSYERKIKVSEDDILQGKTLTIN